MRFKVYRERRLLNGNLSFSVMAEYPDGSVVHEEVKMAEAPTEQALAKEVWDRLKARWRARGPKRLSPEAKRDRAHEWVERKESAEEWQPD